MSRTIAIVYNIYFVLCPCRLFSVWCARGAPAWPGLETQLAVATPEKPATGLLTRGNISNSWPTGAADYQAQDLRETAASRSGGLQSAWCGGGGGASCNAGPSLTARAASSSAFRGGDSLSPALWPWNYGDKLSPPRTAEPSSLSLMQPCLTARLGHSQTTAAPQTRRIGGFVWFHQSAPLLGAGISPASHAERKV